MGSKLYVGNLSYDVTGSDLQSLFAPHGTITSAEIIADRDTGRSKGFGFVQMGSDSEAEAAIAALNGHSVGGGLEVAMAADIRIARKNAGKMGLPEVSLGVLPGTGGTQRLSRLIGKSKAIELMATGQLFDFERGKLLGLLNEIVDGSDGADFMKQVMEYARQFTAPNRASRAVGGIKRAVQTGAEIPFESALALERELFLRGHQIAPIAPSESGSPFSWERSAAFARSEASDS